MAVFFNNSVLSPVSSSYTSIAMNAPIITSPTDIIVLTWDISLIEVTIATTAKSRITKPITVLIANCALLPTVALPAISLFLLLKKYKPAAVYITASTSV